MAIRHGCEHTPHETFLCPLASQGLLSLQEALDCCHTFLILCPLPPAFPSYPINLSAVGWALCPLQARVLSRAENAVAVETSWLFWIPATKSFEIQADSVQKKHRALNFKVLQDTRPSATVYLPNQRARCHSSLQQVSRGWLLEEELHHLWSQLLAAAM